MYDILNFSNSLLTQITQYNFFILTFLVIKKKIYIIFLFFLYSLGEKKFVYSNKLLTFGMKSINTIQNKK